MNSILFVRYFLIFCILAVSVCPAEAQFTFDINIPVPETYVAGKTDQPVHIDGKDDESDWGLCAWSDPFTDIASGDSIPFLTRVKMMWDDSFLYIYAYMEEPHLVATLTEHDAVIYHDNDFEIFIDPSGNTLNYFEIEVNALGTIWDLKLDRPYRSYGKAENGFELHGMKYAVNLEGSLNDPNDSDTGWSVEFAIPYYALTRAEKKFRPAEGITWRVNFSRVQWEYKLVDGTYVKNSQMGEENWVWSKQGSVNMHLPENWGFLQFSESPPAKNTSFTTDYSAVSQQVLYAVFMEIRKHYGVHLEEDHGMSKKIILRNEELSHLNCHWYRTHSGFEIVLHDPIFMKSWVINELGIAKQLK